MVIDPSALFLLKNGKRLTPRMVYHIVAKAFANVPDVPRAHPHMLRHTVATTLLFNGCPIGHIKELLGHERLDTTCRYYLGLDMRAAKEAHGKFLTYE